MDSFVQPEYNSEITQMPESKHTEYLERIIELAEKNGSQILLIKTPYVLDESYDAIYNGVAEIAQENGVTFINMNEYTEKISFDFSTCMADTLHLNNVGAELVTNFFGGEIIQTDYAIQDHREDDEYSTWNEYCEIYNQTKFMSKSIKQEKTILQIENGIKMLAVDEKLYMTSIPVALKKILFIK